MLDNWMLFTKNSRSCFHLWHIYWKSRFINFFFFWRYKVRHSLLSSALFPTFSFFLHFNLWKLSQFFVLCSWCEFLIKVFSPYVNFSKKRFTKSCMIFMIWWKDMFEVIFKTLLAYLTVIMIRWRSNLMDFWRQRLYLEIWF